MTAVQAKLIVREAGLESVTAFLAKEVTTIGRDFSCDVRLHSPYVSRVHARLQATADGHLLIDGDGDGPSTNGVSVNGGDVIDPLKLRHADQIEIANVVLWYMIDVPVDQKTPRWEKPAPKLERSGLVFSVDNSKHQVWIEGRNAEISLAPLEFRLLSVLYSRRGKVSTREEIGAAVWGEAAYDLDMLYRLVQRLKEKIEDDPAHPRFVISHRGIGYSLEVEDKSDA